jgi:hypothetical protein
VVGIGSTSGLGLVKKAGAAGPDAVAGLFEGGEAERFSTRVGQACCTAFLGWRCRAGGAGTSSQALQSNVTRLRSGRGLKAGEQGLELHTCTRRSRRSVSSPLN